MSEIVKTNRIETRDLVHTFVMLRQFHGEFRVVYTAIKNDKNDSRLISSSETTTTYSHALKLYDALLLAVSGLINFYNGDDTVTSEYHS